MEQTYNIILKSQDNDTLLPCTTISNVDGLSDILDSVTTTVTELKESTKVLIIR